MIGGSGLTSFAKTHLIDLLMLALQKNMPLFVQDFLGSVIFQFIFILFFTTRLRQLIHDVCIQELPIICIRSSWNYRQDGQTHHGVFDYAFMLPMET